MSIKYFLSIPLLLGACEIACAQQSNVLVSLSAGLAGATNQSKSLNTGNGFNFNADGYFPFYRKGVGGKGAIAGNPTNFTAGILATAGYSHFSALSPGNNSLVSKYQVYNTSTSVTSASNKNSSNGYSGFLGLQGMLSVNKIYFAPSVSFGYLHTAMPGYTQKLNLSVNGKPEQVVLTNSKNQTINTFSVKPQLKIGYHISPSVSILIQGASLIGGAVSHSYVYLVPQRGFNEKNMYEWAQLKEGKPESQVVKNKFSSYELHIGVSFTIGKRPAGKGIQENGIKRAEAQDFNTTRSNRDNRLAARPGTPIGGVIIKGGKNPGGQMLTLTTNDNGEFSFDAAEPGNYDFQIAAPAGKGINENGIKRVAEPVVLSLKGGIHEIVSPRDPASGLPTGKRQYIKLKTRHETAKNSVSNVRLTTNTGDDEVVVEDGRFSMEIAEPGNYSFQVSEPQPQNQSIVNTTKSNTKDWKVVEIDNSSNPQEPTKASLDKVGDPAKENLDKAGDAAKDRVAGGPLKGIDVKLGKSPNNGIQARAKTNKKGEVEFKGLQPGIYEMEINLPQRAEAQDFNTTRSNREGSNFRTDPITDGSTEGETEGTTVNARPGGPIGGIIVKGGKNPGGGMTNLTVDNDGKVRFEVLEAGDYTFQISAPQPQNHIVNTTKSNTKDWKVVETDNSSAPQKSVQPTATSVLGNSFGGGAGGVISAAVNGANTVASPSGSEGEPSDPAYRPGQPIGGITVKGGKNPGGQMLILITNDNGEFSFDATQPGNYLFQVTAPEPAGKGIQEDGVKRAETQDFNTTRSNREGSGPYQLGTNPGSGSTQTNAPQRAEAQDFNTTRSNRDNRLAARPGGPIGGIIVKGGKNPGGQMLTLTTNENGEFSFDATEPGNYKFEISAPVPAGKGIQEAGVKRTEK